MCRFCVLVACAACAACSHDSATIQLVTGEETDTFTQAPVPTTLQVDAVEPASDGGVAPPRTLATAPLSGSSVDLGDQPESIDAVLTVTGLDANGNAVVYGATVPVDFGTLAGTTLSVFVQRTGELARLPNPLSDSRPSPLLAVFDTAYLLVAGGSDPTTAQTTQLYDFVQLSPFANPPTLPEVPLSIAFSGSVSWLFDADGGSYFDFSDSYTGAFTLPSNGGGFADIAGGATIADDTGAQYVVGATRTTGSPTRWVLKIDPNDTSNSSYPYGNVSWLELNTARLGAAAAWVPGSGLVVAGGNMPGEGGDAGPPNDGVEEFAGGTATVATTLGYVSDPSSGSGAVALDDQNVLLAGGVVAGADVGVRVINLGGAGTVCTTSCTPTPWTGLPYPLVTAQAFATSGTNVLVVGNEASPGTTHVFEVTPTSATEIMTKVPHANARAIASPTGTVVLFGGAPEIESFTP